MTTAEGHGEPPHGLSHIGWMGSYLRNRSLKFVAFAVLMLMTGPAKAVTPTDFGYITTVIGGLVTPIARVQTTATYINPDSCTSTDGYVTSDQDSGVNWLNSMLLSAYMGHRQVRLIIDGCWLGRPHIIGVEISPN